MGWGSNKALYAGGDVIFGIEDCRPTARDVYSGDKIWEGSASFIANKIQIGDGWVVYWQFSGQIQCFDWKKPYISPHRPSVVPDAWLIVTGM